MYKLPKRSCSSFLFCAKNLAHGLLLSGFNIPPHAEIVPDFNHIHGYARLNGGTSGSSFYEDNVNRQLKRFADARLMEPVAEFSARLNN
jgi:hypothetical protein